MVKFGPVNHVWYRERAARIHQEPGLVANRMHERVVPNDPLQLRRPAAPRASHKERPHRRHPYIMTCVRTPVGSD